MGRIFNEIFKERGYRYQAFKTPDPQWYCKCCSNETLGCLADLIREHWTLDLWGHEINAQVGHRNYSK